LYHRLIYNAGNSHRLQPGYYTHCVLQQTRHCEDRQFRSVRTMTLWLHTRLTTMPLHTRVHWHQLSHGGLWILVLQC